MVRDRASYAHHRRLDGRARDAVSRIRSLIDQAASVGRTGIEVEIYIDGHVAFLDSTAPRELTVRKRATGEIEVLFCECFGPETQEVAARTVAILARECTAAGCSCSERIDASPWGIYTEMRVMWATDSFEDASERIPLEGAEAVVSARIDRGIPLDMLVSGL